MILHLLTPLLRSGLCIGALNVLKMEGPPVPLCQPATPPPTGAHKKEPCKRFFRDEKNREQFACAAASTLLALALETVPMFCPNVRLRGITHKAESNSNCLGQATVVLVRWTFQPVAALIVRHVSSGQLDTYG